MYSFSNYVFSPLIYFFNNNSNEYYNNININKDFEILGDELDSFDILNEIIYEEDILGFEKTNDNNFAEQYKKNWDHKLNEKILKDRARKKRNRHKHRRNKNKKKTD